MIVANIYAYAISYMYMYLVMCRRCHRGVVLKVTNKRYSYITIVANIYAYAITSIIRIYIYPVMCRRCHGGVVDSHVERERGGADVKND